MRRVACALCLMLCAVSPTWAVPRDDFHKNEEALKASRERQAELEAQRQKLVEDLGDLQKKLVRSAGKLQDNERELSTAEDKLRILDEQRKAKEELLATRQKNLSGLMTTVVKLSQLPPEAVVVMPGDTQRNITAARALKMMAQNIREETASLQQQMDELNALKQKVIARRTSTKQQQNALDKERKKLAAEVNERKLLQEKVGQQSQEEARKIDQLAKKSGDLRDLLDNLEEAYETIKSGPQEPAVKGKLRSFSRAKGKIRSPLAGEVIRGFHEKSEDGMSKGLLMQARSVAQVVAPYDGEVVFTGPFLTYGKMVIVRHRDDFHSLLAGLKRIDVRPGQFLLEGEPIGAMGDADSDRRLYLELRKDNQPIDPKPWLKR